MIEKATVGGKKRYREEARVLPGVLKHLCEVRVGQQFSIMEAVRCSIDSQDVNGDANLFMGYLRSCSEDSVIDYGNDFQMALALTNP